MALRPINFFQVNGGTEKLGISYTLSRKMTSFRQSKNIIFFRIRVS